MSSLFLMSTITDRRTADAFLQLYEAHGVNVTLRTVGTGTAVQETLSTLGLEKTEKAVLLHRRKTGPWVPHGAPDPDLEGGEYLEGYPL